MHDLPLILSLSLSLFLSPPPLYLSLTLTLPPSLTPFPTSRPRFLRWLLLPVIAGRRLQERLLNDSRCVGISPADEGAGFHAC